MELVYLWVEDYKNIHEQGFNFSPRFDCHYDGKELTIKENDDYIENFFGENINVTVIVGKNGSGKSSLLKAIRKGDEIGFLLFYNKIKKVFHIESRKIKPSCTYPFDYSEYNIYYPLFDYSLSYDKSINDDNFRDDFIIKRYSIYPNKKEGQLNFFKEVEKNQKNIIDNYLNLKENNELQKFENFFQLQKISISLSLFNFKNIKNQEILNKYYILINSLENSDNILDAINIINNNLDLLRFEEKNQNDDTPLINVQLDEKTRKFIDNWGITDMDDIFHPFNGLEHDEYNIWENINKRKNINNNNLISQVEYEDNDDSLDIIYNDVFLLFNFNIDDLSKDDIKIISSSFYSKYFIIELMDKKDKKLSNLSFGEQQLIFILNQLYFLRKKKSDELDIEVGLGMNIPVEYIVLLDEIDIGFHPDWQKRTLQYIIDFLELIPDKSFHLILTSHSPFILSDLPKENIIFLKDGKQDKGIRHKQTFGANIHTLLSDSFFMEDGLMGEFAKGKINSIKKFYELSKKLEIRINENDKSKKLVTKAFKRRKEKFHQIQKIIGEPFLQKIIKNYLDELEVLFSDDKTLIDKELAEIEERRVYLESLKKW